jgi:hypothetical protein
MDASAAASSRVGFRPDTHQRSVSPHHCALLDLPLSGADLRTDCPEHEPAA